jgi:PKD domain
MTHDKRSRPSYRLRRLEVLEPRALLADGISPVPGPPLHAVAGVPLTDALFATYTVTDASSGPGDQWRALVNFGDGQVDGPLIPVEEGEGFAIVDTHTYKNPGTYTVTVMIAVPGSHQPNDNTVTTQVTVTAGSSTPTSPSPTPTSPSPPPSPTATGLRLRVGVNRPFLGPVARVSDPHTGAHQLSALISWGDQSPPTAGLIRSRGRGRFQVVGSHAYTQPGRFSVLVTIRDSAGHELLANGTAIVRAHR